MRALATLALATVAPVAATPCQGPADQSEDPAAIVARARDAWARGDQRVVLASAVALREHDPADIRAHYLIGAAAGSHGPSFSRVVALQAFARVASLARGDNVTALRGLAGVPARLDLDGLRATLDGWRRELEAGRRLLLAPDRATAARLATRLRDRIEQIEAWVARERDRLARARKQKTESERALRREQTRKRRAGETFVDVQPIVDRIWASERSAQTSLRRIGEFEALLDELRGEADRADAAVARAATGGG